MKAKELLESHKACFEAVSWAGDMEVQEAWDNCHRGDWMLWIYAKVHPENIMEIALAKGHCANTARHLMKDQRSIDAVDAAIAYGEGRMSREELKNASASAYAASAAAAYDVAADVVYAAAGAVYAVGAAAYAAVYAADTAAYAADAAAYAADAAATAAYAAAAVAAYHAAEKRNQIFTANICRKYLKLRIKK